MVVTNNKYFFDFLQNNFEGFPTVAEKAVIVSFFGKSLQDTDGIKNNNFKLLKPKVTTSQNDAAMPLIQGCYDINQNVIYLHLKGVLDIHYLIGTFNQTASLLGEKGYLTTWATLKHNYAKSLLFLFSISHIIIVCHPVPVFDLSYIHLFRALDAVRVRACEKLSSALTEVSGINKEWYENGRPCPPRMLFRFDSCPKSVSDVKKLEHALEDQIYLILRKCKIISNLSSNSLFAIPINQEFVFVETNTERPANRVNHMVNNLIANCLNAQPKITRLEYLTVEHELKQVQKSHCFDKFLMAHVDIALTKGFDDNVGRHLTPAPFTVPSPTIFFEVAKKAYAILVAEAESSTSNNKPSQENELNLFETLRDHMDIDAKFSEARCSKVLPLALAQYQQNSPFHYTREYHESKLAQAMTVLALQGRGSMMDKYATQLEKECLKYWQNGRQMCQVLSLTGHPCTNAIHKGGSDEGVIDPTLTDLNDREREGLEVKEHSSSVRYVSTCNCGRRQAQRPDPYTLKSANFEFYNLLAEECGCDEFDVIRFPIFQPSTKDYRAAQLLNRKENAQKSDTSKTDLGAITPQDPYSSVYISEQSGAGSDVALDPSGQQSGSRTTDQEIIIHISNNDNELDKDKNLIRQPSTTEYLPFMLHTESPAGLLPQFSSWSLVCLGPSSLYSHNLGLQDQPGLIPGSSYLLPWDVTVRLEHEKKSTWSNVSDYRKTHVMRVRKNKGDQSEFVVKIFIGVEYECPRGHRFMAAGPDKILKTSNCGQVKDTGQKVTSTDMPLYFPCVCRSNKPLIAQLMRIHMVTPKAPVRVTLNPKVQPAPNAPIFIASTEQPIALTQSAYWILRLPYVYMTERGPFFPPQEQPLSHQGRFLSGCYGITEIPSQ